MAMSGVSVEVLRATFARAERVRLMKHHEEKCAARRSPIDPIALARVRKNLFAEDQFVFSSTNSLFVEQELRRIENVEKARWNFDFANEKPVDDKKGTYKWELYNKPQMKHLVAPKPRRIGQAKVTDYMPKRKGLKRASDGKPALSQEQEVQAESVQIMQVD
ncbi:unnamed protein product [Nezara viridula]|uniref:Cyclin-dependent kinase inhibitor domain-containing protein n=1 Tax=Nezara viridula TaxID=85310 RepID=A0A9P0H050_NEZVI|nr:unnamed protein product [Nezara viridula]